MKKRKPLPDTIHVSGFPLSHIGFNGEYVKLLSGHYSRKSPTFCKIPIRPTAILKTVDGWSFEIAIPIITVISTSKKLCTTWKVNTIQDFFGNPFEIKISAEPEKSIWEDALLTSSVFYFMVAAILLDLTVLLFFGKFSFFSLIFQSQNITK